MTPEPERGGTSDPSETRSAPRAAGSTQEPSPLPSSSKASIRSTNRSLSRIRILRALIGAAALALVGWVGWSLWRSSPDRAPARPGPPPPTAADDTVRSLERFEFNSTLAGKPAYSVSADRLLGTEAGLHLIQGVRSVEITRPDGSRMKGHADHGSVAEEHASQTEKPTGNLVLEGGVEFTAPGGERLSSDRLVFSQKDGTLLSPGRCRFSMKDADGESGELRYEMKEKTIRAGGGVRLRFTSEKEQEIEVRAESAIARTDGSSATLTGAVEIRRGEDVVRGPEVTITRGEGGSIAFSIGSPAEGVLSPPGREAHDAPAPTAGGPSAAAAPSLPSAAPSVSSAPSLPSAPSASATAPSVRSKAPSARSATPSIPSATPSVPSTAPARPVRIRAERIEGSQRGDERRLELRGAASLDEEPLGSGPAGRHIEADEIVMQSGGASGAGRVVTAQGRVRATFPDAPAGPAAPRAVEGVRQGAGAAPPSLTARRLEARFGSSGAIESGEASGGVTVLSEGRTARAEQAHLRGETLIELRGGRPNLSEPDRSLTADEIDIARDTRHVEARGSVRARFVPSGERQAALFVPGQPVDVSAEHALIEETGKTGTFTGAVVARQGERALSAASLTLDDAARTARATGTVTVRGYRQEDRTAKRPGPGAAPARVPVRIDADTLMYEASSRSSLFEGHAVYREPARMLSADRIRRVDEPTPAAGAASGEAAEILAQGSVAFEGEGKKGRGERARYTSRTRTLVLEGIEKMAEVVETSSGRAWRGPALTWVLGADSIPTVSGATGRSTVVGSGRSSGRSAVGK